MAITTRGHSCRSRVDFSLCGLAEYPIPIGPLSQTALRGNEYRTYSVNEFDQRRLCERFGAEFLNAPADLKVGISRTVLEGQLPLNGLRHPPQGDTTGWYIWGGEAYSDAADFFVPLHVAHLDKWSPLLMKYLGLAPGWRFLVAGDHEDVWYDEALLRV